MRPPRSVSLSMCSRLTAQVWRSEVIEEPIGHRGCQRTKPVDVVVLEVVGRCHQAHTSRRVESCEDVRELSSWVSSQAALTKSSIAGLGDAGSQRSKSQGQAYKERRQCRSEDFRLPRVQADAERNDDQRLGEEILENEHLARRDECHVDGTARYHALLWYQPGRRRKHRFESILTTGR